MVGSMQRLPNCFAAYRFVYRSGRRPLLPGTQAPHHLRFCTTASCPSGGPTHRYGAFPRGPHGAPLGPPARCREADCLAVAGTMPMLLPPGKAYEMISVCPDELATREDAQRHGWIGGYGLAHPCPFLAKPCILAQLEIYASRPGGPLCEPPAAYPAPFTWQLIRPGDVKLGGSHSLEGGGALACRRVSLPP